MRLIFDAHLDLAWNALSFKRDITRSLDDINAAEAHLSDERFRGRATVSLPAMRAGGVAVCLATLMGRVPYGQGADVYTGTLDFPSHDQCRAFARGQLAYYEQLESRGEISIIRTASQLRSHWSRWAGADADQRLELPVGVILAMEGCDAIASPAQAEEWFAWGLRSAALVHYGRSRYAVGTGDDGPLTPDGREMLRAFEASGMILDVTHLSDTSFAEAIEHFDGPIHATHQNCRALVPGDRQFSDEQIKAVIVHGGVLGAAMDAWMLYPGWQRGRTLSETTSREFVPLDLVADQMDHIRTLAGDARPIAIGSDLDGGFGTEQAPLGVDHIGDLQKLAPLLESRGYDDAAIDGIFHGHWLAFFERHLPA